MADKILDRLAKILNQAENAATDAERDAFMSKAQEMATTNAIDLAVARQHTAKQEQREQPEVRTIRLGAKGTRLLAKRVTLISTIGYANDVKFNIYHDSTAVIAFGFPSDIDVVEALYASLVTQMTTAGDAYLASGEYKNETVTALKKTKVDSYYDVWTGKNRNEYDYEYVTKPVDGRVARASFYDGFTSEIRKRLQAARADAVAAYEAEVDLDVTVKPSGFDSAPGAAVALLQKEVEVRDFYKEKSTARGSWRGGSSSGHSRAGSEAGRAAGRSARLSSHKALA